MVGAEGFEPPTLCSQSRCATRLRYAPMTSLDCSANRISALRWLQWLGSSLRAPAKRELEEVVSRARISRFRSSPAIPQKIPFDATIDRVNGGYSSAAERLTVAQDVVGSIPTSRPNDRRSPRNIPQKETRLAHGIAILGDNVKSHPFRSCVLPNTGARAWNMLLRGAV